MEDNGGLVKLETARGETIALYCWPELRMTTRGSHMGIDALLGSRRIQIKFDRRIAETGNLYHEVYERTVGREGKWRASPHACDEYIFTTEGYAYRVPLTELVALEVGQELLQISTTSIGFLVPLRDLLFYERREHSL